MAILTTKQQMAFSCGALLALLGCEDKPAAATEPKPQASVAVPAAPLPTPVASAKPSEDRIERTKDLDTEVTEARRTSIESKFEKAKGFVVAKELEEKLKANKALKDKKSAIAAFDRAAKGKWVLFSGPAVNLTDTGFDVGIVYTPQLPNDPMGMSRQFFEVTLSDIEGYAKDQFKAGDVVVVLAQYDGAAKAAPGHELVAAKMWK